MARHHDSPDSPRALLLAAMPRLQRFAYAMTGSRDDGDDLTQVALERALQNINRWRPGTSMESWVLRIAYNAWIDEVRLRKRRGRHLDLDSVVDLPSLDGQRVVEASMDCRAAREAMAELPDDHRVILALVALDGMSYQDIAEMLKIPIGTVMSRVARARKAVARKLERAEQCT